VRASLGNPAIEFVAVMTSPTQKSGALAKVDSVLGNLHQKVTHDDSIAVDGKSFRVFKRKIGASRLGHPSGRKSSLNRGPVHHGRRGGKAQARTRKKVIISAPATGEDLTVVLG